MNEVKEILVTATGTVTITTKEYRSLLERSAYLNILLDVTKGGRSYVMDDVINIINARLSPKHITQKDGKGAAEQNQEEKTNA